MWRFHWDSPSEGLISYMWIQSDSDLISSINFQGECVTRLMCSPLASNFWSRPVLVHKGLIHGVMTSLPWQTGLQSQQSCTITLACSVGYKWRSYQDSPSECVTRLMCSPLAGNFWSTPVLVHKGLWCHDFSALADCSPKLTVMHHCTCMFSWPQMEVPPRFPLRRFDQLYVDPIRQWSHKFNQLSGGMCYQANV